MYAIPHDITQYCEDRAGEKMLLDTVSPSKTIEYFDKFPLPLKS